jgi:hypothetical protein
MLWRAWIYCTYNKEKIIFFHKEKPKKRKPQSKERLEGLSRFLKKKFIPIKNNLITNKFFLQNPIGLDLYSPVSRLIFAFLFLVSLGLASSL